MASIFSDSRLHGLQVVAKEPAGSHAVEDEVQQRVAAVAGAVGEVHAELRAEGQLLSAQQPLHQGLPAAAVHEAALVDGGVGAEVRRLVEALAAAATAVRAHVLVREAHVLSPRGEAEALLAVRALVVPAALVHGGDVLPEPGRPGDALPAVRALHGTTMAAKAKLHTHTRKNGCNTDTFWRRTLSVGALLWQVYPSTTIPCTNPSASSPCSLKLSRRVSGS